MSKRRLSIGLLFLALSACAVRSVERNELAELEATDAVTAAEVLTDVQRALAALQALLRTHPRLAALDMHLERATATLQNSHGDTDSGAFALLLAGAGESRDSEAGSTVKLVLVPVQGSEQDVLGEADGRRLAATMARLESRDACGSDGSRDAAAPGVDDEPLWQAMVVVTVSALDAYACSAGRNGASGFVLDEMTVTLAVDAARSDHEGATLTLGTVAIGDTATQSGHRQTTIELDFKRRPR